MKNYFDITIKAKKQTGGVMGLLFNSVHSYLSSNCISNIGVSFPNRNQDLGWTLRLHSDESTLHKMISSDWLKSISSLAVVGMISEVPSDCGYEKITRQRLKMSSARLRRLEKRGNKTADEIAMYKKRMATSILSNPYLDLKSTSSSMIYRMFFKFEVVDQEVVGKFNEFGLSQGATVPVF